MEENFNLEKKKGRKGLIVTIVILILLLLGALGYIAYDKGYLDKLLGKEEPVKEEIKEKENKLSEEEVLKLHDSLIAGKHTYGLYIDDVSIDTIAAKDLIPHAIINYIKDKNIRIDDFDENGDPLDYEVSKSEIDNYIKEKYNTDRTFTLTYGDYGNGNYLSLFWPGRLTSFNYDAEIYSLFNTGNGDPICMDYHKFLKSEQEKDTVYIYDKEFGLCTRTESEPNVIVSNHKEIISLDNDNKKYKKDKFYEVDDEAIFNDYADKMPTFKHTFKKGKDGKYYWYSSEIVKE